MQKRNCLKIDTFVKKKIARNEQSLNELDFLANYILDIMFLALPFNHSLVLRVRKTGKELGLLKD